uniref:ATP-dependent DNA helicase Q5 n=1 Tax=Varanus komodoensis TaxID=61221 RepID=A0A8D2LJP3_VARKO
MKYTLCLPLRCRHAAIAKYFGDGKPQCNKCCDYCKNAVAVKRQVEALQRSTNTWSRTCIGPSSSAWNDYDSDLYEGGKKGYRRYDEDSGSLAEANEEKQKKEWNSFYKKQMNLRKVSWYPFYRRQGLFPQKGGAREHCLKMLEEALNNNQQAAPTRDGSDAHSCAVEMEYEAFQTSKMANLYKATVLKKVRELYDFAKEIDNTFSLLFYGLYNFKPKRVGIGFPKTSGIFQSASEVLMISSNWKKEHSCDSEPVDTDNILENKVKVTKEICKNADENSEKGQHSTSDSIASSGVCPTMKGKATKRQLLLAEAAKKESQNIVKFFSISKAGSKTLASECDIAEEENSSLSEIPQSLCEEKTSSWETDIATKEARAACCSLFKDLGSPVEKRLRMMDKYPISLQSDGKAGGLAKKKVTFDPNLSQVDKEGTTKTIQPKTLSLKETADIVVKYLTPYYKNGKFASKVGYYIFVI